MNESNIHVHYKPLYTSKKRYFLLTGSRASLKSTTVHDFIARLTFERGHGILFTRYTMVSAEKSIIPEFRNTLQKLDIEEHFHITNNKITNLLTGSFIIFSGIKTSQGDQTANLKSIAGITTFVVEEGEDFNDENAFDNIEDSIRGTAVQNRIIWIMNSATKHHFIYERWIEPYNKKIQIDGFDITVSTHPDVEAIHTTFHIAEELGYLSKDWLKKVYETRENKQDKYAHKYLGAWIEQDEGVIFPNWIEGPWNYNLDFCYGQDYGFFPDPYALVAVAVDEDNMLIHVHEIAYNHELSYDDIVQIYETEEITDELIVTDTNEKRTTTDLADDGYNIEVANKKRLKDDIRTIKDYTIVVTPESTNVKKELNSYVWNNKRASIPIDDNNHALDGVRYAFNALTSDIEADYNCRKISKLQYQISKIVFIREKP